MSNYLMLDDRQIELTQRQVDEIKEVIGFNQTILSEISLTGSLDIEIGKTKRVAGKDFIILDVLESGILCLAKEFVHENIQFDDDSNNYANSKIRKRLNTNFLAELSGVVGRENIIAGEIDLISEDGLGDYGKVVDRVGLLTADIYRKYNRIIEQYPVDKPWWLATPWSTPHRGYRHVVRCVRADGTLINCYYNSICGVRPFCIFDPIIFQS